jgi:hypothetical protein
MAETAALLADEVLPECQLLRQIALARVGGLNFLYAGR